MDLRNYSDIDLRRKDLEKELKISLKNIGSYSLDAKSASKKNCENMIGASQVPMGIAGPLLTAQSPALPAGKSEHKAQSCFVPLATTEGALVASVNRGCKAIKLSDGVIVASHKTGVTRAPVFYTGGIIQEQKLYKWVNENKSKIKKAAESTSSHLKFKKLMFRGLADYVFIRFAFDSQDAMGMNMATLATEKIVKLIEKETGIKCISISGNFDVDKKPSWLNFIESRGHKSWAEVVLKKSVIKEVLKTSAERMYDVWLSKNMLGSAMSGSLGFNAHFANVIASIFLATGQDIAHTVEGSMGMTTAKIMKNEDLYFSIYIPSLMVGTVGGGTYLNTQKEALNILGIAEGDSGKNSQKLAEIIGGAVLAGEISLIASLSVSSLGISHRTLGRGEKI
jgi:hydroxymethylglutaryl-CoA reductase (NADPH)